MLCILSASSCLHVLIIAPYPFLDKLNVAFEQQKTRFQAGSKSNTQVLSDIKHWVPIGPRLAFVGVLDHGVYIVQFDRMASHLDA
jgi:hypothetical protein